MLKNLLYLYNDGHNPFPKLGKGGLGYHLPGYKLKGKGMHLNASGEYDYDDNDNDLQVYDQGFIIGNYKPMGDNFFYVEDDERGEKLLVRNPKKDESKQNLYKHSSTGYEVEDVDEIKPIETIKKTIDKVDKTIKPMVIKENKKTVKKLTKEEKAELKAQETALKAQQKNEEIAIKYLIESSRETKPTKTMINALYKSLLTAHPTITIEQYKSDPEKYNQDALDVYNGVWVKKEEKKAEEIKKIVEKEADIDTKYKKMSNKEITYEEHKQILSDVEYTTKITKKYIEDFKIDYAKTHPEIQSDTELNFELAGKGLESFLASPVGSPIVKTICNNDDIDVIRDLGNNSVIPTNVNGVNQQLFCVIDNFSYDSKTNKGYINEIKDLNIKLIKKKNDPTWLDYEPIQTTKFEGTEGKFGKIYDILFYLDKGKYYPYDIKYKKQSITDGKDIQRYNLISTSDKGIVKCDMMELINNPKFKSYNNISMNPIKVGKNTLYSCKINSGHNDIVYGKEKPSLRIPKSLFYEWNK